MREKSSSLQDVNYLRAFGVVPVILIHISSEYVTLPRDSFTYQFWGVLNNLCSFAVPLFLFISALTLAYSTAQRIERGDGFHLLSFYRRRLDKILFPFLIWTALYFGYRYLTGVHVPSPIKEPIWLIKQTILGAYYHLYYLTVALQLYFFFPLFVWLRRYLPSPKKRKAAPLIYAAAFLGLCLIAYLILRFSGKVVYPIFPHTATTLLPYVLPIAMGLWFGFRIERLDTVLEKCKILIVAGFILFGTLYVLQAFFLKFIINSTLINLVRMIYSVFAALAFLLLCRRIREGSPTAKVLKPISQYSFFIYLAHPLFLHIGGTYLHLRELVNTPWLMVNFSCGSLFCLIFVLGCSLGLGCLCHKLKLQRFLG